MAVAATRKVTGPAGRDARRRGGFDVVVGRQPIFDGRRRVFGYELLFRRLEVGGNASEGLPENVDALVMTPELLFNSVSIGLERLVADKRMFINADRALLTGTLPILLPPDRVVVEILETVSPEPDVIAGCRRLAARRFTLALDDFVWFDGAEPMLELASIVKIDVLALATEELRATIERCRRFDVRLVAEKVETPAQLAECKALGFDYFQGYLLARPDIVAGRSLDPTAFARLQLVARLLDAEGDAREIEALIVREPSLAQQLLQLAGIGAEHGTRRQIRTLRDAIVLVGLERLQSWAGLMLLIPGGDASREEATTALVRARMCELLAAHHGPVVAQQAFTAGMVAAFDLLLGMRIEQVVDALPLAPDLRAAVLGDGSTIGRILADVIDFQLGRLGGRWRCGLGELGLTRAWTEALEWSLDVSRIAA